MLIIQKFLVRNKLLKIYLDFEMVFYDISFDNINVNLVYDEVSLAYGRDYIIPNLSDEHGVLWIVIDNLRYDQYRMLEPFINNFYKKEEEYSYYSILPTATQYARNSIFSGLMPSEMEKLHPRLWKNDTDAGCKNMFENEFLSEQIKRSNLKIKHIFGDYNLSEFDLSTSDRLILILTK